MASNINYIAIDETFPIAGRDNDSQGFRDNFSVVKNNFAEAKGEIEDLQLNTARLDAANDFNGENLLNFNMTKYTETFYNGGLVSATTLIEFSNGPCQIFTVGNNLQFTLYNWPNSENLAKIRVHIFNLKEDLQVTRTVTFATTGGGTLKKSSRVPASVTVTSDTDPIVLEFWTYDKGNTVYMDYLGAFV